MKFRPLIGTDLSGSVGGITASRNRGGAYFRNRGIPIQPNTPEQQAIKAAMSQTVARWNNSLTTIQRDGWDTYAFNVPLIDPLGEPRNVGGLGMYNRSNIPRIQNGLAIVDDAPTVFNLGDYTAPSIASIDAATDILSLAFTVGDDWVDEDEAAMVVYISRPQSVGKNFFKGPYRLAAQILGDSGTPPTSPAAINLPFPVAAGNKVFTRVRVMRADGRLSSDFRDFALAT